MSDDDLRIAPDAVKTTGLQLAVMAVAARAQTGTYFASSPVAAQDNLGFAVGAQLTAYATKLQQQMNGFIDDLDTNAQRIVDAAATMSSVDQGNTDGFNRELSALNGLTKPPLPGHTTNPRQ